MKTLVSTFAILCIAANINFAQFGDAMVMMELIQNSILLPKINEDLDEAQRVAAKVITAGNKLGWKDAAMSANNHLVKVAILNARYDIADSLSRQSLDTLRKHEERLSDMAKGGILFARAMTLTDLEENRRAVSLFQAAIDTFNREDFSFFNLSHLGEQAESSKAYVNMLFNSLGLKESKNILLGHTHNGLAFAYRNLGSLDLSIQQFHIAMKYYRRAKSKLDEANTYVNLAETLHGKSWDQFELRGQIMEYLDEAIAIYKTLPEHDFFLANAYSMKGMICNIMCKDGNGNQDTKKAIELFKKAKQPTQSLAMPKELNLATCYLNLAHGEIQQNNPTEARYYLKQGMAHFESMKQTQLVNFRAAFLLWSSTMYYELEGFQEGLEQLDRGLDIINSGRGNINFINPNGRLHIMFLAVKAHILETLYETKKDKDYLLRSYKSAQLAASLMGKEREILSENNQVYGNLAQEHSLLTLGLQDEIVYKNAMRIATELATLDAERADEYKEAAFQYGEKSKSYTLRKAMRDIEIYKGFPEGWRETMQERATKLLAKRKALATAPDDATNLIQEIKRLEREQEAHFKLLQDEHTDLYNLLYEIPAVSSEQVQTLLDDKTAALHYILIEDVLHIHVVRQNQDFILHTKAVDSTFYEHIRAARVSYIEDDYSEDLAVRFYNSHAQLYDVLIKPIEETIQDCDRLIIVPDGLIHYVNFDLLHAQNTVESIKELPILRRTFDITKVDLMIQNYALSYVPSSTILYDLDHRKPALRDRTKKIYGGVAPEFKSWANAIAVDSTLKAFGIEKNFSSSQALSQKVFTSEQERVLLYGAAANEENFYDLMAKHYFSILHLSTHAIVDDEQAYLVLSNSSEVGQDDLIQLEELYNTEIVADVTLLEACQSAYRDILLRAEGTLSLERAFFKAGCSSLLGSMWDVEVSGGDKNTLVFEFCKLMKTGTTNGEMDVALRQVKLALLDDETINPRDKMPYFWAALRLAGEREHTDFKKK